MTLAVPRTVSTGSGLLMAALAAVGSHGFATAAAGLAALAVVAGAAFRRAATVAVVFTVAAIALGSAASVLVVAAGFFATIYLVVRHTSTITTATVIAAAGFGIVGLVATSFPLQVPWLPLLAAPAAFGCYALVTSPFLGRS